MIIVWIIFIIICLRIFIVNIHDKKYLTDINGQKLPGILFTIKGYFSYKYNLSFVIRRVIVEILWRSEKRSEKIMDETEDIDRAIAKRSWYANPNCFQDAKDIATILVGNINNLNYEEIIEYYYFSLTYLYKVFTKSWLRHQLSKLCLLVL